LEGEPGVLWCQPLSSFWGRCLHTGLQTGSSRRDGPSRAALVRFLMTEDPGGGSSHPAPWYRRETPWAETPRRASRGSGGESRRWGVLTPPPGCLYYRLESVDEVLALALEPPLARSAAA